MRVEAYLELAKSDDTPLDMIYYAAQELDELGDDYREASLKVIDQMLAPSRNPTQREFLFAADVFKRMGVMDKVIDLCLKAANHPETSYWDFKTIISLAKSDNPKYTASLAEIQAKVVRIFELKANKPNASYVEILSVADCFTLLGEKYVNRAAELYEKGIVLAEEKFNDIKKYAHGLVRSYKWAEYGLEKLGEKYSNRVAVINKTITALNQVIANNFKDAENTLREIAQQYPQDSNEYKKYMWMADELSKD